MPVTFNEFTDLLGKVGSPTPAQSLRSLRGYPTRLARVCDFGRLEQCELDALFAATEVGSIWGVGKRITEKLKAGGIRTVLDLVRADSATLRSQFSVTLEKTLLELRGTSCMDVDDAPAPRQQTLVSRSFGKAIVQVDGIIEAVGEFTSRAAERLRGQGSVTGALGIFFMISPFRRDDRQHSVNVTVPLMRPTADSAVLVSAATAAVRAQFRSGFNYAKAGAVLSDLRPVGQEQGELDLFSAIEEAVPAERNREKLMSAMDALNHRFSRDFDTPWEHGSR